MSIRLKLTLIYNAILVLTLIIFGVALYTVQSNSTIKSLRNDLRISSETLSKSLLNNPANGPSNGPGNGPGNGPSNFQSTKTSTESSSDQSTPAESPSVMSTPGIQSGTPSPANGVNPPPVSFENFSGDPAFNQLHEREIVRVLDSSGNLVASPMGRTEDVLPLSAEGLSTLQSNEDWWEIEEVNDQDLLIYSRPIIKNDELIYILQVARPLNERASSLHDLRNTLIMASLIAVVVAFGVGWIISGITLQPIHKITQTAQSIGKERDFSKRVTYKGPQDEIGTLATTFNSMLSRLENAYQRTARSLEMQRNFVADVSHELRTPLTTLRGNLGLLRRTPPIPQEEQNDILNDMVDESDRLIRLVNNLLELASADSGRNLRKEFIEINPIMGDVYHQALQMEPERKITFSPSKDCKIFADRDALLQVLLIGVDNSLKHTSGDISISSKVNEDHVDLIIEDSGEGISQEQSEHIFDRFYRGEDPSSHGFGLGLPIAKALVEGMGGKIVFYSQVNKGSQLILTFDLFEGSSSDSQKKILQG